MFSMENFIAFETVSDGNQECLFGVKAPETLDYGATAIDGIKTIFHCAEKFSEVVEVAVEPVKINGNQTHPGVNIGNLDASPASAIYWDDENFVRPGTVDMNYYLGR